MEAVSMSQRHDTSTAHPLTACLVVTLITLCTTSGCDVDNAVTHDPAEATQGTVVLPQTQVTRHLLDESLGLGKRFLLARQTPHGDFRYQVNFVTQEESQDPAQVRKAGSLWGVALIHHDQPTDQTREALLKGFAFYRNCSRPAESLSLIHI